MLGYLVLFKYSCWACLLTEPLKILPLFPLGDCKLSCLESLFVGSKAMVALSLAELPGNTDHLVLAMGGLDNKIHLYCGQRTGKVSNFKLRNCHVISCMHFSYSIQILCGYFVYASSLFVLVN